MFDIGIIDPPWSYDNKQQKDSKRGGFTYPPLSRKELRDLPLGDIFSLVFSATGLDYDGKDIRDFIKEYTHVV